MPCLGSIDLYRHARHTILIVLVYGNHFGRDVRTTRLPSRCPPLGVYRTMREQLEGRHGDGHGGSPRRNRLPYLGDGSDLATLRRRFEDAAEAAATETATNEPMWRSRERGCGSR